LLGCPAGAAAATRYASPQPPPNPPASCPQSEPCDIVTAVNGAQKGDEVVLSPGSYGSLANPIEVTLDPPSSGVAIHGVAGQPRPVLTSNADQALFLGAGDSLRWLEVQELAGGAEALVLAGGSSSAQQVIARATGSKGVACEVYTLLRNSVCWSDGAGGYGVESFLSDGLSADPTLQGVSAVATGKAISGIRAQAVGSGTRVAMTVVNTIAIGADSDVSARGPGVGVSLHHSNFGIRDVADGASVTPPGTGTDQLALPVLKDVATGDLRQCPSSPTRGAGAAENSIGGQDVAGGPREVNGRTDIGAYQGSTPCSEPGPGPGPSPGPGPGPGPSPGPSPGPGPGPTPTPSNQFQVGNLKRLPNGTATLFVTLPGAGSIELRDARAGEAGAPLAHPPARPARVLRVATRVYGSGRVGLRVVPNGVGRRILRDRGRVALPVAITYQPLGGSAATQRKQVVLLRRR
jgi:hypothetical protein